MLVCLPSIMHTGTHLMRYTIFHGKIFEPWTRKVTMQAGVHYRYSTHVNSEAMPLLVSIIKDECDFVICPMRHPARVMESFKRRARVMTGTIIGYEEQWHSMIGLYEAFEPMFIHVDSPERDAQVQAVADTLDIKLHTEWPVHKHLSGAQKHTHNLKVTDEMVEQVPKFVMDFYNELIK